MCTSADRILPEEATGKLTLAENSRLQKPIIPSGSNPCQYGVHKYAAESRHVHVHMYIDIYGYVYIYIYIQTQDCMYVCMYVQVHYIYIYLM